MIAELLGFAEFLLPSMSEISGWRMKDIKLIAMDGKFDEASFWESMAGMFFVTINSQPEMSTHISTV